MIRILGLFSLASVLFASIATSTAHAQKKAAPADDDPQLLSFEVMALRTLHRLDLTMPQLETLLRLSKNAASSPKAPNGAKVTSAFVSTLKALRSALLEDDEDRIDDLKAKLGTIMDKDKIQLDDRVPISDTARRGASQVIRMLRPAQVLAYAQVLDDDDVDLLEMLEETLDRGKGADAAKWKTMRDQAAVEGAWLLAGSDEGKARLAAKNLASLLDSHHSAKPGKSASPDLEKQVQELTSQLDPFTIVRNAMEREMAELLSNPRLPQALQHTLEQRRKLATK